MWGYWWQLYRPVISRWWERLKSPVYCYTNNNNFRISDMNVILSLIRLTAICSLWMLIDSTWKAISCVRAYLKTFVCGRCYIKCYYDEYERERSPLRFIQSVLGRTSLAHQLAFRNFCLSAEWNQPLFFHAGVCAGALKANRFDRIKYNRAVGEACALSHTSFWAH